MKQNELYFLFSSEMQLCERLCPSIRPSVHPSVGPTVTLFSKATKIGRIFNSKFKVNSGLFATIGRVGPTLGTKDKSLKTKDWVDLASIMKNSPNRTKVPSSFKLATCWRFECLKDVNWVKRRATICRPKFWRVFSRQGRILLLGEVVKLPNDQCSLIPFFLKKQSFFW